jgi:hypothetical protein
VAAGKKTESGEAEKDREVATRTRAHTDGGV